MKFLLMLLFIVGGVSSHASQQCDCSDAINDCTAEVYRRGDLIEITAATKRCAQVLFYTNGFPNVALVTDGRSVVKRVELPSERLIVGQCKVCRQVDVSVRQRLQASIKCPVELLMFTEKTNSCMNNCNSMTDSAERSGCQLSCQQYNRCLESTCVEALRRKLKDCGRQCDREMQSSMAADIDVYDACMSECKIIKQEISSCPVL